MDAPDRLADDGVIPIRVLVRVRPLSKKELQEDARQCVRCFEEQNQISCNEKMFAFDAIFDPSCQQDDVYQSSAGVLVEKIFSGYNCTILAYGQTGSGKTFTMGTEETTSTMLSETRGIVPRIVDKVFELIRENDAPSSFAVSVSMLEVYDDKVLDLLTRTPSKEGLNIREKDGIPFVQGLSSHAVATLEATMAELERGCSLRSKGETAMNASSSRSHAVFTITIQKRAVNDEDVAWNSKLRLVDLAGSERLKKTKAEGDRKKEGIKINEGLHALGKVIQALSTEEKHIPYRDSKITRLLQDSLGGNSFTVMIACVSPADSNGEETLSTLRYADRVKCIKNKPTVQIDPKEAIIQKLREENGALRLEVAAYRAGEIPEEIVPVASLATLKDAAKGRTATAQEVLRSSAFNSCVSAALPPPTPRKLARRQELDEAKAEAERNASALSIAKKKIAEILMQKAAVSEKAMLLESEVERLTALQEEIKTALSSEDCEAVPSADEALSSVRAILEADNARKATADEEEMRETALEGSKLDESGRMTGDDEDPEDNEGHVDEMIQMHEKLEREMAYIMKQIDEKEKQFVVSSVEQAKFTQLEKEYRKKTEELQARMSEIEKEKLQLLEQLKKTSLSSKIAEERRKRLQEIEKELAEQRKKMAELRNVEKMRKQSDETVKKLKVDIAEMKQARVKMTKQLRSETDKYRHFKMAADKRIAQMQLKERKRDGEVTVQAQKLNKQLTVYRRKYEEAAAANKRLQAQLMRSAHAVNEKIKDERNNEQWKQFLEGELDLVGTIYDVEMNVNQLISHRKALCSHKDSLEKRIQNCANQPPSKRREIDSGAVSGNEALVNRLQQEKADLEEQIDLCSQELSSLQSKAATIDMDARAEQRWNTVKTVACARIALSQLFELASTEKKATVDLSKEQAHAETRSHEREREWQAKAEKEKKEHDERLHEETERLNRYIASVSREKEEYSPKLVVMLDAVFKSSERLTDEQFNKLKWLCEKLQLFDFVAKEKKHQTRRSTAKAGRSASEEVEEAGSSTKRHRSTKPPERFGDMVNTIASVKGGEEEDGEQTRDDQDSTFRHHTGRKRAASAQPKGMSRQSSRSKVVLRPSPIKTYEEEAGGSPRDTTFLRGAEGLHDELMDEEGVKENNIEAAPNVTMARGRLGGRAPSRSNVKNEGSIEERDEDDDKRSEAQSESLRIIMERGLNNTNISGHLGSL